MTLGMLMESCAKLLPGLASLAWPVILLIIVCKFRKPLKKLIESLAERKFTIKVDGYELTMEQASEIQRGISNDIMLRLTEIEKHCSESTKKAFKFDSTLTRSTKRILWVDDSPKNNSFYVALLEEKGIWVDIAENIDDGIKKFEVRHYDFVISNIRILGVEKAGIDLAQKIKKSNSGVKFFIFCDRQSERNLSKEPRDTNIDDITSSITALLPLLLND